MRAVAQDARHRQRLERRANHVRRAHTIGVVRRLGREEFGVGEDHAQLVVEPVKKSGKIARFQGGRAIFSHGSAVRTEAFRPCGRQAAVVGDDIRKPSGCRHRESVKIRMLPPAVRTYSTFPAAIQL